MKAVSYLRCSGESQIQGDTWSRQVAAIEKYAAVNSIELAGEFRDEGVTGKMELEGRAGLSACIAFVREQKIDLVLVEDSTRLARDLIVAEVIIREMQKAGVRVIAASGGVDLTEGDESNPTAKLIRQILAAVSEFERCCITIKLRGAKARKRLTDSEWSEGRKAYGSKPGEREILARMHELAVVHIPRDVAAILNEQGHRTRYGRPWHKSTVAKILAR